MQKNNLSYYLTLLSCIALVAVCFMPWTHYNSANLTFSGYHVTKFANGTDYGKPWKFITVFCTLIFLFTLWQNTTAKKTNLFLAALLFAYSIRTYILFTSSLFEGEVSKYAGIYLLVLFPVVLLVCAAFPKRSTGNIQ